jgi:protein-S-isoprenylcysteine O-methyltransferase Ste14
MFELIHLVANRSANPQLFMAGMLLIYSTGLGILIAVAVKFVEHGAKPRRSAKVRRHAFSTREMLAAVLLLFPFWVNSIGQLRMTRDLQSIYFGLGVALVFGATAWHIWAKMNIRAMWSDGIEIQQRHVLHTAGAYALARHPMYASLLLWCWGASLAMFNWATLALTSCVILPLMAARARAEESELTAAQPEYLLYQNNVRGLTVTLRGVSAMVVRIGAILLFAYCLWRGITLPSLVLLLVVHVYLGMSLTPEKVAFSYRSKSGMMLVIFGLSLMWSPVRYAFYVVLAMFLYGLFFNCPCMIVYDKYHGCPCFALAKKCLLR